MENERFAEENGDISDFPEEVMSYFNTKGSGDVVTPAFLHEISGSSEIALEKYDIYVMGKRKSTGTGKKKAVFYTKMRIDSKGAKRNTVQGLLGVRFLSGFGYIKNGCNSDLKVMRPTNIDKLVTEDSNQFRKRAVIHLNGYVLALSLAEGFCRIPLMDDRILAKFEKRSNAKKREAYARKKKADNEWAHINRKAMRKDNKKALLGMLVPYKKNLGDNYFEEFMKDIVAIGLQLEGEFCPNENVSPIIIDSGIKKRSIDSNKEDEKRVVLQKIQNRKWPALNTIASSGIKW